MDSFGHDDFNLGELPADDTPVHALRQMGLALREDVEQMRRRMEQLVGQAGPHEATALLFERAADLVREKDAQHPTGEGPPEAMPAAAEYLLLRAAYHRFQAEKHWFDRTRVELQQQAVQGYATRFEAAAELVSEGLEDTVAGPAEPTDQDQHGV